MRVRGHWPLGLCLAALGLVAASCSSPSATASPERVTGGPTGHYVVNPGIHKIKHVVVIQQENRSFDSYFGTYPGRGRDPDEERRCRPSASTTPRRASAWRPTSTTPT